MATYDLLIKPSAGKELEAVESRAGRRRMVGKIQALASDPRPRGSEKLAGHAGRYRIRQGNHRIVYFIDDEAGAVTIYESGHRRGVYRQAASQECQIMTDSIPWRTVRYLYAAYYLLVGVYLALSLAGVLSPPHPNISSASAAFQGALGKTGFMFPLLAFTYIASACALGFHRTAPLGVVLLAPVTVVIFFTDTLLDTAWWWGTLNAAILAALAWHFRSAYRPLWTYPEGVAHPGHPGGAGV